MLQVSVRFSPEQVKAMPAGAFAALQQEIERRLTPHYPSLVAQRQQGITEQPRCQRRAQ